MKTRDLFLKHIGQTSPAPPMTHVKSAEGVFITDVDDKSYFDLTAGFSVNNIGHRHPKVIKAIKKQIKQYLHSTVYGEHIQSPQVKYAKLLTQQLPSSLDCVYFVNSGSEAIEGAMKVAKRCTGKAKFISATNAYHGSTQGAMSLKSDGYFTQKYRPLLPQISHYNFNSQALIDGIDDDTAGVVIEVIQAEAGVIAADDNWLTALRKKCDETGTQLIFDEIQTGFGRTGKLFAFEHYNITPDILCIAKGMGGGMPIGAFISSQEKLYTLADNPILGHITTFGGHPVSCAASLATLKVLLEDPSIYKKSAAKAAYICDAIQHLPKVKEIQRSGLLCNIIIKDGVDVRGLFELSLKHHVITDGFLFDERGYRIAPPLTITKKESKKLIKKLQKILS